MTPKDKAFDLETFLSNVDGGRTISKYRKDETVFAQGDPANAVRSAGIICFYTHGAGGERSVRQSSRGVRR